MHTLLLHGAIGSSSQLLPLRNLLSASFTVSTLDFSGHASRSSETGGFSIPIFADDVLAWMEEKKLETINIFGYSMGGYVALYLARHYPEKVNRVFTLATKFKWTPEIAQQEIKMLDPVKLSEKVPRFAQELAKRHGEETWKKVLQKTSAMMLNLGESNALAAEDFKAIQHKVLLALGDRDKMVTLDETADVYRVLPNASLLVVPETGHPIEGVNLETLSFHLHNFLS